MELNKYILERFKNKLDEAEEMISHLEGKQVELTQSERGLGGRMTEYEDNMKDLWDNIKWTNLHYRGLRRRRERERYRNLI